jgi:hypothetical protein
MRRLLQAVLGIGGISAVLVALIHIALGPSSIPGSVPVNATMDSEDRFYATIFLAFGIALLWCVEEVERKSQVVYFLALTFFVAGLARIVSMVIVGMPHPFFLAMTALELCLPIGIGFLQSKVTSASAA